MEDMSPSILADPVIFTRKWIGEVFLVEAQTFATHAYELDFRASTIGSVSLSSLELGFYQCSNYNCYYLLKIVHNNSV